MIISKLKHHEHGYLVIKYKHRTTRTLISRFKPWFMLVLIGLTVVLFYPFNGFEGWICLLLFVIFFVNYLADEINHHSIWLKQNNMIYRASPIPTIFPIQKKIGTDELFNAMLLIESSRGRAQIPTVVLNYKNGKQDYWFITSTVDDAREAVDAINYVIEHKSQLT